MVRSNGDPLKCTKAKVCSICLVDANNNGASPHKTKKKSRQNFHSGEIALHKNLRTQFRSHSRDIFFSYAFLYENVFVCHSNFFSTVIAHSLYIEHCPNVPEARVSPQTLSHFRKCLLFCSRPMNHFHLFRCDRIALKNPLRQITRNRWGFCCSFKTLIFFALEGNPTTLQNQINTAQTVDQSTDSEFSIEEEQQLRTEKQPRWNHRICNSSVVAALHLPLRIHKNPLCANLGGYDARTIYLRLCAMNLNEYIKAGGFYASEIESNNIIFIIII